jgi:hypothetical protein
VPTTLAIEVRVASATGGGAVVLQAFAADAASLGGANALWLGERTTSGARAEALDQAAPQVLRTLATMGFTPTPEAPRPAETLGAGESRERELRAEAGRCTLVAAIGGRGLGGLRIELFTRDGDLVARGAQHGSAAVAAVCPSSAEPLRAVVSARTGTGAVLLRTLQNTAAPAWITDIDRVAVSETLADAWARADAGWQAEGTPEKLRVGAGARRVREINRAAGECVRYTASAGRGLPWVSLALRAASGDRVASTTAEGTAVITRCGDTAERLQLELRTDPSTSPEVDAVLSRAVRPDTRGSDAR